MNSLTLPGLGTARRLDVMVVEEAVARQPHLAFYLVRTEGNAIVIFEPHPRPEELRAQAQRFGRLHISAAYIKDRMETAKYAPVIKFERSADDDYVVCRMTYRPTEVMAAGPGPSTPGSSPIS